MVAVFVLWQGASGAEMTIVNTLKLKLQNIVEFPVTCTSQGMLPQSFEVILSDVVLFKELI